MPAYTYLPGHRWRDIEGSADFLPAWADWRNKKPNRMLVLNVPMQERNEEGVPDSEVHAAAAAGRGQASSITTSGSSPSAWWI